MVLVHGITDSGLCWMRLAQALEDAYDLVVYDRGDTAFPVYPRRAMRQRSTWPICLS